LKKYREARDIWSQLAQNASGVYVSDITYGPRPNQRGHWSARLAAIDDDIATMAATAKLPASTAEDRLESPRIVPAVAEALGRPKRESLTCHHQRADHFVPHKDLDVAIVIEKAAVPLSGRLYYRHVNQSERYRTAELRSEGGKYRASIPASYLDGLYP